MSKSSSHLRVFQGNRRTEQRRSSEKVSGVLSGNIAGLSVTEVTIVAIEYGKVVLSVPKEVYRQIDRPLELQNVRLVHGRSIWISGEWFISQIREEGGLSIVLLSHFQMKELAHLSTVIPPELFLRSDQHKLLTTANKESADEISRHFTEIVDFPEKLKCRIIGDKHTIDAVFNFEARTKALTELHVDIDESFSFKKDDQVFVEYYFFSVRYLFKALIKDVDRDFGLCIFEFPSSICAITSRRFDRWKCNISAELFLNAETSLGKTNISEISSAGGEFLMPENAQKIDAGATVNLRSKDLGVSVKIKVQSVRGSLLGFKFEDPDNEYQQIRSLFNSAISSPFVLRNESNYKIFESLYVEVGYGPSEGESPEDWQSKTFESWRTQDRAFAGNTVGAFSKSENDLSISFGTLPMSETSIYCHSLAMRKSVDGIGNFLGVFTHNLSSAQLMGPVTDFIVCARTDSRFSTRVHTVFEGHAKVGSQRFYFAQTIVHGVEDVRAPSGNYSIEECSPPTDTVNSNIKDFFSSMENVHPEISNSHVIKHFRVFDSNRGDTIAWIIAHSSPEYFTAANVFRTALCFAARADIDFNDLFLTLQTVPLIRPLEIDFFSPDLNKAPARVETSRMQEEVFWLLFDIDEMGPILASAHRAAWSVLKKYGEGATEYLGGLVA